MNIESSNVEIEIVGDGAKGACSGVRTKFSYRFRREWEERTL